MKNNIGMENGASSSGNRGESGAVQGFSKMSVSEAFKRLSPTLGRYAQALEKNGFTLEKLRQLSPKEVDTNAMIKSIILQIHRKRFRKFLTSLQRELNGNVNKTNNNNANNTNNVNSNMKSEINAININGIGKNTNGNHSFSITNNPLSTVCTFDVCLCLIFCLSQTTCI